MATLVVDSYEGQDVVIFDVPGAYLNANMPDEKDVRLDLQGEFMDIMCNLNTDHIPNIWYENGKKVIYLRILKALYEYIEWALIWYDQYSNNLKESAFTINPYDRSVANKIINEKQYTI